MFTEKCEFFGKRPKKTAARAEFPFANLAAKTAHKNFSNAVYRK